MLTLQHKFAVTYNFIMRVFMDNLAAQIIHPVDGSYMVASQVQEFDHPTPPTTPAGVLSRLVTDYFRNEFARSDAFPNPLTLKLQHQFCLTDVIDMRAH